MHRFYYDDQPMLLSSDAEEIAGIFSKSIDHKYYMIRETYRNNFFRMWREVSLQSKRLMNESHRFQVVDSCTWLVGLGMVVQYPCSWATLIQYGDKHQHIVADYEA